MQTSRGKITKNELEALWAEYKEVRKRINLPVDRNNESTVQSFINWIVTTPPKQEVDKKGATNADQ